MNDDKSLIKTVVVPTCDRPPALERCLSEILDNFSENHRTPRTVVADNSVDMLHASQNRMIVSDLNSGERSKITLIGDEERRDLLESFVSLGFDRNISSFAINGLDLGLPRVGANRNVLLFATVAESFLSLDDDTRPIFADFRQFYSEIGAEAFCLKVGDGSPTEHWLYPSREVLLRSAKLAPTDFIAAHQTLLGCEVFSHISGNATCPSGQVVNICNARVGITLGGLIGDCGWGTPSKYLFMNENSIKRLTNDSYLNGVVSREMAQIVPGYCITNHANDMMSTSFACDGRILCPPFLPLGRGEDILFARLIRRVEPDVCFGHIPIAVFHDPFEKRRFWPGELFRDTATVDLSSFLCYLVDIASAANPPDCNTLSNVGAVLKHIGSVSKAEFRIYAEECKKSLLMTKRKYLEERLSSGFPMASSYVSDVNAYLLRLQEGERRSDGAIPIELLYRNDGEAALSLTQEIVSLFGELLLVWPEMLKASLFLKEGSTIRDSSA
jgi:hypothetical protein